MIAAAHMLAGASIAVIAPNPWLAIPGALMSHYVLDAIPHREYDVPYRRIREDAHRRIQFRRDFLKLSLDAGGGLLLCALLAGPSPLTIIAALVGFSPDGLHLIDDVISRKRGRTYAAYGETPYRRRDPIALRFLGLQRRLHMAVHWRDREDVPRVIGWPTQAIAIIGLLIFLSVS